MQDQDVLKRMLADKHTSRRAFMVGATALGLSATAAGSLWSGAAKAAPVKGGHLKIGIGGGATSDSLDPATFDATFMITTGNSFRNNVTEIGPDNALQGALAESWEPRPDAGTWVFTLRKGVEWHNGKSLEADDVIASINIHRGDDTKSGAKGVVSGIEDIRADGKDKVVFKLKSPNADFPYILTDYHLNIVPAVDGKADWQAGVGTGAYTLEHFEPGVRADLKINPNRWQQDVGFADSADILLVNDPNARQNGVVTGELHGVNRIDLKTVNLLQRQPNARILNVPGRLHHIFPVNTEVAPFDNNDVRLALKYGVDREEMLAKVLRGHGTLGNDHPIAPSVPFHADLEQRGYDPDKAKFHLKQAGLESLKVDISAADAAFAGAVDGAVLMQEHAAKAGIDINIIREPNDGYWSNVWMKKPWCMCYWGGRPTQDWMFSQAYAEGANWNDTFWSHERLNKLLLEGRGELDPVRRGEIYRDMQQIVRDEGGVLVWAFANYVYAMADKVKHGPKVAANWELDGGRYLERWWFEG